MSQNLKKIINSHYLVVTVSDGDTTECFTIQQESATQKWSVISNGFKGGPFTEKHSAWAAVFGAMRTGFFGT